VLLEAVLQLANGLHSEPYMKASTVMAFLTGALFMTLLDHYNGADVM
jgi:hypothetical protein